MTVTLSVPDELARRLARELLTSAPKESGTFCILYEVTRGESRRLVLGPELARVNDWDDQTETRLTPSSQAISRALSGANSAGSGIAFIHTHPADDEVPHLSAIDRKTSARLGPLMTGVLDGPFASLVVGPGGFAGELVSASGLVPIERVATVGRRLQIYPAGGLQSPDPRLDDRQIRALSATTQAQLRALHVAVVGAGGLGSPVAETLARMGVGKLALIDMDMLDTPSNARRVFGVTLDDVGGESPAPKAAAVARGLDRLGLGVEIVPTVGDVRDHSTQATVLDADLIINGTDTHSSRGALTELVVRAGLPMIDIGVRVGTRQAGQLDALFFERRVQLPDGPCLWCWRTLDAQQVRAELLPAHEREALEQAGYITGTDRAPAPSVAALTVTAAGAAASAALALLSGAFDVAPLHVSVDAITLESVANRRDEPDPECVCARWRMERFSA